MSTKVDFAKLTLMDALDLAALIEIEASRRYTLFAEQLGNAHHRRRRCRVRVDGRQREQAL